MYAHPIPFVRDFFWARLKRIHRNILATAPSRDIVLDFGCGSGVFLPTLCRTFRVVQAVDIEAEEAQGIKAIYNLENLRLVSVDVNQPTPLNLQPADVIVAADVLEHFKDLAPPVGRLHEWLKDDGFLYTSGPSENFFTWAGRKLGRMEKPWDHYHTGYEVEDYLARHGFVRLSSCHVYAWMPMYVVSIWKKSTTIVPRGDGTVDGSDRI